MADVEIGLGKSGRRAYSLDEIAIVPSRRTRDAADVDLTWELDAYRFELPLLGAPMDSVVSPATAVALGEQGAAGVLHLEGVWTRYEDPEPVLARIAEATAEEATPVLQEAYAEPVRPELVRDRIQQIRESGQLAVAALSPQGVESLGTVVADAELDLLVIHGTVVSAEHVTSNGAPVNLKEFVRHIDVPVLVGGCASNQAALHLMRTGAAGVIVGVGTGTASTAKSRLGLGLPQATAIADVRAARMRHLDETGVYCHVIAEGGLWTGGDIARAIACGADGVLVGAALASATEAPGRGWHWDLAATHPRLPRGERVWVGTRGSLAAVLNGPSRSGDGLVNLAGGLRKTMASCGYETVKEFQSVDVAVVQPSPTVVRAAAGR